MTVSVPTSRPAPASSVAGSAQPGADCALCPRLRDFRVENQATYPDFFNAPVPSFGMDDAHGGRDATSLLIVGLAPGLKGANQTGRPFTGDYAGDLLYATLLEQGFAEGHYDKHMGDGLRLRHCRITNAVRCVPPQNKPTGPEIRTCNAFLRAEIAALPALRCIVALGAVSHGAVLSALDEKKSAHKFGHGAQHTMANGLVLADSYHCSRYNTNTRVLNAEMFNAVFANVKSVLGL